MEAIFDDEGNLELYPDHELETEEIVKFYFLFNAGEKQLKLVIPPNSKFVTLADDEPAQ